MAITRFFSDRVAHLMQRLSIFRLALLVIVGSLFIALPLGIVLASEPERGTTTAPQYDTEYDVYGVVQRVEDLGIRVLGGEQSRVQRVTVRLEAHSPASKGLKDNTITLENLLGENPVYRLPVQPGARVLLTMEKQNGLRTYSLVDRDRTPALMILLSLSLLLLLVIGGSAVAKHALLVSVMLYAVYQWLFPAVVMGQVAGWTILVGLCLLFPILAGLIDSERFPVSFLTPVRPEGLPRLAQDALRQTLWERRISIIGVWGGTMLLALILWLMQWMTPLAGFSTEGLAGLWNQSPKLDFWLLYMAGILLGYQGLLFHLCRTLARQREGDELISTRERFALVMQRGRGVLGSLLSSVGMLFLGLLLPTLLLLRGTTTAQLINLESTASIFTFFFGGILSLVLTLPLTAYLASLQNRSASKATSLPVPQPVSGESFL